jgi:hypothetical protein
MRSLIARRLGAATLATAVIVALAGCGILSGSYENQKRDGGVGAATTVSTIESVPGVLDARFTNVPWSNPGEGGLGASAGMDVLIEIDFEPDVSLADPAAALDALVEQAWATNADYPKGAVVIVFDGGVSANFDWDEVVEEQWGPDASLEGQARRHLEDADVDLAGRSLAAVWADIVGKRLGSWPGEPSADFTLDINEGAAAPVLVPALERVSLHIAGAQPVDCWRIRVDRNSDAVGEYEGRIGIELFRDGESVGSLELHGRASGSSDDLCGFDHDEFDATSFTVVATPLDGGDQRFDLKSVSSTGSEPRK